MTRRWPQTRIHYYNKKGTLNLYILLVNNYTDSFKVYHDSLGRKTDYFKDRLDSTRDEECFWESYNEKGDKIVTTYYSKYAGGWYEIITKYNTNGDHTEEDMMSSDSSHNSITLISNSYDDKGRLVEEITLDGATKTKSKIAYKYDSVGNKAYQIHYKPDSILSYQVSFKYDERRNLRINTIYNADLSIHAIEYYSYDKHNNLIQLVSDKKFIPMMSDFTIKYKYDNQGNWIKKIEDVQGRKKPFVTLRTIEYYD